MQRPLFAALPWLALSAPLGLPSAEFVFAPESGLALTKTWEAALELQFETIAFELRVGGEAQEVGEQPVIRVEREERTTWRDDYATVEEGRVLELVRTFDEIEASERFEFEGSGEVPEPEEREGQSDLAGAAVRFTWDPDAEEYTASYEDGEELEEDWLAGLEAGTDLVSFLPEGEVELGDTWELEVADYLLLRRMCGELHLTMEEEDGDRAAAQRAENDEALEGELAATYAEDTEWEGTACAAIDVEGHFESEGELDAGEDDAAGTETTTLEVSGRLFWDPAAGRFLAAALEVEFEQLQDMLQTGSNGEVQIEVETQRQVTGTIVLDYRIEPAAD